jgi:branched-chain amino acid transport system substrate-binding protein
MSISPVGRLAMVAAMVVLLGGLPAVALEPGVTAESIKIGTFGALTGPGYL